MCNCGTSTTKTGVCPVVIVSQGVDPNSPLITGYPTNTLCFVGFPESGGNVTTYANTEAMKIYKWNGASWDLVYNPIEQYAIDGNFVTAGANLTIDSGVIERTMTSFALQMLISNDGSQNWNTSSVIIATVSSAYVPASNTIFTAWIYCDIGAGNQWLSCGGFIDTSGNIYLHTDRMGGSVSTVSNIEIDFTYSATRQ